VIVSAPVTGWKHFHYNNENPNLQELQYYLKIDQKELSTIEQELKNLETENESKRIQQKFDNLGIDELEMKLFEERMSEIIAVNESAVRQSITPRKQKLARCRSVPRSVTSALNVLPTQTIWKLNNLDDLKLCKELSRNPTYALWKVQLGDHVLAAQQIYNAKFVSRKNHASKVRFMRSLEHPHIVRYYGVGRHLGQSDFFVFKEFINGVSVSELVKSSTKNMNEVACAHVLYQVLSAVAFLHERKIIHGNIQPKNILISTKGVVKIDGFNKKPNNFSIIPHYSAPEVVSGFQFTEKSDIWSIGCIAVELLTGKAPFSGENPFTTVQELIDSFDIPDIPSDVTKNAASFLGLCFKTDPKERPSAAELLGHYFLESQSGHSSLLGFIRRQTYKKETSHNFLAAHTIQHL